MLFIVPASISFSLSPTLYSSEQWFSTEWLATLLVGSNDPLTDMGRLKTIGKPQMFTLGFVTVARSQL